jgi:hypothetical protein
MQVREPIALAYKPVAFTDIARLTGNLEIAFNRLAAATARDDMLKCDFLKREFLVAHIAHRIVPLDDADAHSDRLFVALALLFLAALAALKGNAIMRLSVAASVKASSASQAAVTRVWAMRWLLGLVMPHLPFSPLA